MALFSETFKSLDDLFMHHIKDVYDAEHRICEALPEMSEKATNPQLVAIFDNHLGESKTQISRLERIFKILDENPDREKCQAIAGLLKEGEDILKADGSPEVIDAGLIAAAQRVEHYEMASYGTLRAFATRLGHTEIAEIIEDSLNEEKQVDERLSKLAMSEVNPSASASTKSEGKLQSAH